MPRRDAKPIMIYDLGKPMHPLASQSTSQGPPAQLSVLGVAAPLGLRGNSQASRYLAEMPEPMITSTAQVRQHGFGDNVNTPLYLFTKDADIKKYSACTAAKAAKLRIFWCL